MNTESNTEGMIKTERRKVFQAMNSLPWILLFLVVGFIAVYFYKQNQALNVLAVGSTPATPKALGVIIEPTVITNIITNVVERFSITTNTIVNLKIVTNTVEKVTEKVVERVIEKTNTVYLTKVEIETKLRTELEGEYIRRKEIDRKRFDIEIEIEKIRAGEEAIKGFQVEAISNEFANWVVSIEGNRSFAWKTNDVIKRRDIHGMSIVQGREYPFTIQDLQLAREINLDIEKELNKSILTVIESNFVGKVSPTEIEFKKRLGIEIGEVIKKLFDGFETYQKEKRKWLWTK